MVLILAIKWERDDEFKKISKLNLPCISETYQGAINEFFFAFFLKNDSRNFTKNLTIKKSFPILFFM